MIGLILPVGSPFPTINGRWWRMQDGRILARYTRDELAECKKVADIITAPRAGADAQPNSGSAQQQMPLIQENL